MPSDRPSCSNSALQPIRAANAVAARRRADLVSMLTLVRDLQKRSRHLARRARAPEDLARVTIAGLDRAIVGIPVEQADVVHWRRQQQTGLCPPLDARRFGVDHAGAQQDAEYAWTRPMSAQTFERDAPPRWQREFLDVRMQHVIGANVDRNDLTDASLT